MGIFNFAKEAGETLRNAIGLGGPDEQDLAEALQKHGLTIQNLDIKINGSTATVSGLADTQAEREKAILVIGNSKGIDKVEDAIRVTAPRPVQQTAAPARPAGAPAQAAPAAAGAQPAATQQPESKFYQVKPGDTLSKIAKEFYGEANAYGAIFEANKPMLSDPDKIYPGQVLRIPPRH